MGRRNEEEYRFSENAIEWLSGERYATVTVSQRKWVDTIKAYAKEKKLKRMTVNSDGSITARIPTEWVRIEPKGVNE